jgi:glucose-1-phosphate thymidylyltransferase
MNAIIPVAGVGTRLRPHTFSTPKALLPVAGKPVLAHILDQLMGVGLDRVVLVVGYLGDQIVDWVKANYDIHVDFVEQTQREGLGHAVLMAMEGADMKSGPAVGVLGDTIFHADLAGLVQSPGHAMGVKAVEDPRRFGVAETEGDRITNLVEKPEEPKSNLALVGLYSFADLNPLYRGLRHIVDNDIRTRGEYQLTDALMWMIEQGEHLSPYLIEDWYDVGKPETWLETNQILLEGCELPGVPAGVELEAPVFIHPEARVEASRVGPNVSIGAGSEIIGSTLSNCVIDEGCRVESSRLVNSLLGARTQVRQAEGRLILGNDSAFDGEKR